MAEVQWALQQRERMLADAARYIADLEDEYDRQRHEYRKFAKDLRCVWGLGGVGWWEWGSGGGRGGSGVVGVGRCEWGGGSGVAGVGVGLRDWCGGIEARAVGHGNMKSERRRTCQCPLLCPAPIVRSQ